jgi:predicted transcriptional regulator
MRQKFIISQNDVKNELKIREYAIIDKIPKNATTLSLKKENYSLLGEETYRSEIILGSISKGRDSLIATLRTRNLFPIEPYAQKIAESVIALYKLSNDNSVELFFDDVDLLSDSE